jgi:hypothetical protein
MSLNESIVEHAALRDALLAKLVSGELRLADSPKRLRRFHARRIVNATDPSK